MAANNFFEVGLFCIDLQHPEVLTCEQLCRLFEEKQIAVEPHKCSDKEELLKLYYRTLMPLPQRNYKTTRRGLLLSSKREELQKDDSKATTQISTQKTDSKIKLSRNFNSSLVVSSPQSSSTSKSSRNLISFEKTTIKLHSSPINGVGMGVIPMKTEATDTPDNNKRRKIIRLINDTITSNKNGSSACHTSKRKSMSSFQQDTSAADESTPKKKHKPIVWP